MKLEEIEQVEKAMNGINKAVATFANTIKGLNVVPMNDLDLLSKLMDNVPGSTVEYSEYGDHNGLNCYFTGDSGDSELLVCFWFDVNTNKLIKITGSEI